MKELNLHEEIIKSLKLISYDRSLTLNEQVALSEDWAEDLLGPVKQAPIVDHQKIENELKKLYDQKFYKQNRLYLPKIKLFIFISLII
jgi:hypothetical protein